MYAVTCCHTPGSLLQQQMFLVHAHDVFITRKNILKFINITKCPNYMSFRGTVGASCKCIKCIVACWCIKCYRNQTKPILHVVFKCVYVNICLCNSTCTFVNRTFCYLGMTEIVFTCIHMVCL